MSTVLEYIADIAPSVDSDHTLDKKNRFINIAKSEVDSSLFTNQETLNLAIAYYASHLLELTSQDGSVRGSITQEKEGELSRSYSGTMSMGQELNTTQYLESYKRLIRSRNPSFYISDGR